MRYLIIICAVCLVACGSRSASRSASVRYGYRVVATWPHDTEAYTQGLFWHAGSLWESTGEYGRSTMRRVDLATGRVERETRLGDDFFGEGAALVGNRIYQLTWLEGRVFIYDAETLTPVGDGFSYRGQGWGLASEGSDGSDGGRLYMSDGTPNITVRNPSDFRPERTIIVRRDGRIVNNINELEMIDGLLWANVYLSWEVLMIDPEDGRVVGVIDFSGLENLLAIDASTDVMNGIAHDPATGRTWVTGKNWNALFEIEIFKQ